MKSVLFFLFAIFSFAQGQMSFEKTSDLIVNQISVAPNGTIFVSTSGLIYFSTDGGINWEKSDIDTTVPKNCFAFNDGLIYVGTNNGVFKSIDFGKTFLQTGLQKTAIVDLLFSRNNNIIAIVNDNSRKKAYFSYNNGYSWKEKEAFYLRSRDASKIKTYSITDTSYLICKTVYIQPENRFSIQIVDTTFYFFKTKYASKTHNYLFDNVHLGYNRKVYIMSSKKNFFLNYNIKSDIIDTVTIQQLNGINDIVTTNDEKIFLASSEVDGVYYSENNGKSWQEIYQGLNHDLITCLAIDSTGTLFAGTNKGIYKLNQLVNNVSEIQNKVDYKVTETTSQVTIQLNDKIKALGLYDIIGHKKNYINTDNKVIIEKNLLSSGIYFLVLRRNDRYKTVKILIK